MPKPRLHFSLIDIQLFASIAEVGSLTHAANQHHISVGAASERIKSLEQQVGLPLFFREARGVRLTPPGAAFLHHARELLRQVELLRGDLQDFGSGLIGLVRVAANTTAVVEFLPEILAAFLASHPHVNVELRETPNSEIARMVAEGRADLGITAGAINTQGLEAIFFSQDRLVLVTSLKHRLAQRSSVKFEELLDEEFVGMHTGSTLHTFLVNEGQRLGQPPRFRIQLVSFDAVCRMVAAGVGISVLPESVVHPPRSGPALATIPLENAWSVRDRFILVRDSDALPLYAAELVHAIKQHHASRTVAAERTQDSEAC